MSAPGTNPSALLAESLASLSKSTYQAFAEIENRAHSEVARAVSDAREARDERDRAINGLHMSQLEGQAWKQEVISCKASLKQAETSITHQAETIAQLRREANTWKDQSRNWQEHFLRVEQERCTLSTRIDELVAERLRWCHPPPTNVSLSTPDLQYADHDESAPSSTTTKRASTSSSNHPSKYIFARPLSPPAPDPESPSTNISVHKLARSVPNPLKPSKSSQPKRAPSNSGGLLRYEPSASDQRANTLPRPYRPPAHTQMQTLQDEPRPEAHQRVIRRVNAVVTVKREDTDDESLVSEPMEEEVRTAGSRTNPRRMVLPHDDDDDEYISDGADVSYISGQSDEGDGDDGAEESVNGDDELMMGAEVNHNELYGTDRVNPLTKKREPSKKRKRGRTSGKPPARRKH